MKTIRPANPLPKGDDVKTVQTALAKAGFLPSDAVDGVYGPQTIDAVVRAKRAINGKVYPPSEWKPIAGDRLLTELAKVQAPRDPHQATRAAIVANALWGAEHEPEIHYAQVRPILHLRDRWHLPLTTDCSGFATLCYSWAGAPDPNGLAYSGNGYTGTMLHNGRQITPRMAKPGDLIVFGRFPGHHVVILTEPGPDPLVVSHGQEAGPAEIRLSVEQRYQPQPATFLTYL